MTCISDFQLMVLCSLIPAAFLVMTVVSCVKFGDVKIPHNEFEAEKSDDVDIELTHPVQFN